MLLCALTPLCSEQFLASAPFGPNTEIFAAFGCSLFVLLIKRFFRWKDVLKGEKKTMICEPLPYEMQESGTHLPLRVMAASTLLCGGVSPPPL